MVGCIAMVSARLLAFAVAGELSRYDAGYDEMQI